MGIDSVGVSLLRGEAFWAGWSTVFERSFIEAAGVLIRKIEGSFDSFVISHHPLDERRTGFRRFNYTNKVRLFSSSRVFFINSPRTESGMAVIINQTDSVCPEWAVSN